MNTNEILQIMKQFDQSSMEKMVFKKGELSFEFKKGYTKSKLITEQPTIEVEEVVTVDEVKVTKNTKKIPAPIVGIYYESPAPDKPPFVSVGSPVKKGQVLCIIEAMKVMNEVVADQDGVVCAIHGVNGDLVEYGQIIFELE